MFKEANFAGVYFSSFILQLLVAAVPFFACRWLLARLGLLSRLWHLGLFELSLFVLVLGAVVYQ